jgi:hypothetical protein
MTNQHPITPPIELVQQWLGIYFGTTVTGELSNVEIALATQAARWGSDTELEACCEWFQEFYKTESWVKHDLKHFRAARRPKPPTLNSIALQMLSTIERDAHYLTEITDTIRRALEALSND